MSIRKTIELINRLETEGVINRHAVGGAVGATFYLEPVATVDVDVFVAFREQGGLIMNHNLFRVSQSSWRANGRRIRRCRRMARSVLPAEIPLLAEAIKHAVEKDVEGTEVRVFTAEHLAAVALQTGRAKDKARLLQFVEGKVLDMDNFKSILSRHGLEEKWKQFEKQFLGQ